MATKYDRRGDEFRRRGEEIRRHGGQVVRRGETAAGSWWQLNGEEAVGSCERIGGHRGGAGVPPLLWLLLLPGLSLSRWDGMGG